MHLELETVAIGYRITGYTLSSVTVNTTTYTHSLIVMPHYLNAWTVAHVTMLTQAHVMELLALQPQVVLLGTGEHYYFPEMALWSPLLSQRIGVEVMTTPAACRTYNILMAEGRAVAAALIVP
ncbi:MAG: hypothetical protein BWK79_03610 [Beggiatoa sp. IS2]|nr:MAG: hypothetical protein BWK79_03610 [Beggiatoa sp. IS2]